MLRTRFAPSPNGLLHLGHAFAALVAHDRARAGGGEALLRIEDIDGARSRPELAEGIREDLAWLGVTFREVAPQSARIATYRAALDRLRETGLVYRCRCSRAEIAAAATEIGPDGPVYPGTCRGRLVPDDAPAVWRLDMAAAIARAGPLAWTDEIAGEQVARPGSFGDVVLWRKDAPASYHLAATLDDAADGITLVTRGADLFAATHVHRLLQALLGLPVPAWHHHALLVEQDAKGHWTKLAKRRGSPALAGLRAAGMDGRALANELRSGRFPAGISLARSLDHDA